MPTKEQLKRAEEAGSELEKYMGKTGPISILGSGSKVRRAVDRANLARGIDEFDTRNVSSEELASGQPSNKRVTDSLERVKDVADEYKRESTRGVRSMKKGGMVRSSASKRADGCAIRGKTKGKMV